MSGFKSYPAYKDSGVEWLGEVPEHWALIPIKHLASLNPRKSDFQLDTELLCSFNPNQTRRVYNTLVMLAAMMDIVSPGHLWKGRLQGIIKRHHIQTRAMGFPDDWQQRPIWTEVQESGR